MLKMLNFVNAKSDRLFRIRSFRIVIMLIGDCKQPKTEHNAHYKWSGTIVIAFTIGFNTFWSNTKWITVGTIQAGADIEDKQKSVFKMAYRWAKIAYHLWKGDWVESSEK